MSVQQISAKANATRAAETMDETTINQDQASAATKKAPGAFLTISEVSDVLDVPHHVLRFWETKFSQVKPLKRGGGRRYYRPEDVEVLKRIHSLLYTDKYTIKGAQKLLKGKSKQQIIQETGGAQTAAPQPQASNDVRSGSVTSQQPVSQPVSPAQSPSQDSDEYKMFLKDLLTDLKELRDIVNPKND